MATRRHRLKAAKPWRQNACTNHPRNQPPSSCGRASVHMCRYQLGALTRPVDACAACFRKLQMDCPSRDHCPAGKVLTRHSQAPFKTALLEQRPRLFSGASSSQIPASHFMQMRILVGQSHFLNWEGKESTVGNVWVGRCLGWKEGGVIS